MIYSCLKPLLFSMDPEDAHNFIFSLLRNSRDFPGFKPLLTSLYDFDHPSLESEVAGLRFKNPVGLAAGFDKNAELLDVFSRFGFGFLEGGTITAKAQPGNPKPRVFRLKRDQALINRLGFNNQGAGSVAQRLKRATLPQIPIGLNIGKSKVTDLDKATEDYLASFEALYPFASYFTINVSSPNTPRLRELQNDLGPLLAAIQKKNAELAGDGAHKPVFVKIAPDLDGASLDQICDNCAAHRVAGIIATNTTLSREGLQEPISQDGGLSGKPVEAKANRILRLLYQKVGGKMALIGVGGIFSAEDAYRKIRAGANLVQIYTGWIYEGPGLVKRINQGLVRLLQRDGFQNIQQAVGVEGAKV